MYFLEVADEGHRYCSVFISSRQASLRYYIKKGKGKCPGKEEITFYIFDYNFGLLFILTFACVLFKILYKIIWKFSYFFQV